MTTLAITPAQVAALYPAGHGYTAPAAAVRRALDRHAAGKGSLRQMVLALADIDRDSSVTIGRYSDLAAVRADAEDYAFARAHAEPGDVKGYAERRHARRELAALDLLTEPDGDWAARNLLVAVIRSFGVRLGDPADANPPVHVARDLATMYRSWRTLCHYPQYAEHHSLRAGMVAAGLLRGPQTAA